MFGLNKNRILPHSEKGRLTDPVKEVTDSRIMNMDGHIKWKREYGSRAHGRTIHPFFFILIRLSGDYSSHSRIL